MSIIPFISVCVAPPIVRLGICKSMPMVPLILVQDAASTQSVEAGMYVEAHKSHNHKIPFLNGGRRECLLDYGPCDGVDLLGGAVPSMEEEETYNRLGPSRAVNF